MANQKRKVVLATGVFDLLHLGHIRFLEDAKNAGGEDAELVVVVAKDSTAEKLKGKKPIMNEEQRRALVESLKVVNRAVLGHEGLEIGEVISEIEPDVIALGWDQTDMEQKVAAYLKENELPISVVQVGKFGENSLDSSSKIKQEILDKFATQ